MNTTIIISVLIILLLITIAVIWSQTISELKYKDRIQNWEIKNTKLTEKYLITEALLYELTRGMLASDRTIKPNTFPFSIKNPDTNRLETVEVLRFKKYSDKVLVYLNGTINPSNACISVQDINCLDHETTYIYTLIAKALNGNIKSNNLESNSISFLVKQLQRVNN